MTARLWARHELQDYFAIVYLVSDMIHVCSGIPRMRYED